ncbi:MAG: PIG-L family deacetylase [Defluviitaleaceae bacterium]|nr:PIG-L family deacetylase [Defluviitaleaceae bacterium]
MYINLRSREVSGDISLLFPGWDAGNERVAVFGAHDDDPLLGAGYAMYAAMQQGAEVFAVIFCQGDCGYSSPAQKDTIVETRRVENENAFVKFGMKKENIIRLEYPDFSLLQFKGKQLQNGGDGSLLKIIQFIRDYGITRVFIPNGYREHSDHTAAYDICMADIVQAGDSVVSDCGRQLQQVKSYLQYSVWADFSPEDALVHGADPGIRANRAIISPPAVEQHIHGALREYASQGIIIENLMQHRLQRKTSAGFVELYIALDPRPVLDFAPYMPVIEGLLRGN